MFASQAENGRNITIERFEELLTAFRGDENLGEVDVVTHNPRGPSIFRVVLTAAGLEP